MGLGSFISSFDGAFVINLDRRPDRLIKFRDDMLAAGVPENVLAGVQRFPGIVPPDGNGVVGCIMSHVQILRKARELGMDSVVVFEDDAAPLVREESVGLYVRRQLDCRDWSVLYMGCNAQNPLQRVDISLYSAKNCFATHALAYHRRSYDYIISAFERGEIGIYDVWMRDHAQNDLECYGVFPMLFTQSPGVSDIQMLHEDYSFMSRRFGKNTEHFSAVGTRHSKIRVSFVVPVGLNEEADGERTVRWALELPYENVEVVVSFAPGTVEFDSGQHKSVSGTVVDGISACEGMIVKPLRPGDFLIGDDVVHALVDSYKVTEHGFGRLSGVVGMSGTVLFDFRPTTESVLSDVSSSGFPYSSIEQVSIGRLGEAAV